MKRRHKNTALAGLGILTVTSAVGLWSATNSSIFALKNFAKDEESKKNAKTAMNLGLLSIGALSVGSYFITRNTTISLATFGVGLLMYLYYDAALKKNPTEPTQVSGIGRRFSFPFN